MDTPPALPPRRSIDLAAAAHLEIGLGSLQVGDVPRAVGAFAAIDDASWDAILQRFPTLPNLITRGTSS